MSDSAAANLGGKLGAIVPAGFRLIALDAVGSTNEEALRLAAEGTAAGTVVWAREQTKGRGRRGRVWESPPGNLYCSLVLRPRRSNPAQVSFVAAVALANAIAALTPDQSVQIKWPNDVLLGNRKVAGILLEGMDGAVVLGTGVNVAQAPEGAASIAGAGGVGDIETVLHRYLTEFSQWYRRWEQAGFDSIREAWLTRATGLGREIEVRLPTETVPGTFAGLDAEGVLLLDTDRGVRRIAAGDVYVLDRSAA